MIMTYSIYFLDFLDFLEPFDFLDPPLDFFDFLEPFDFLDPLDFLEPPTLASTEGEAAEAEEEAGPDEYSAGDKAAPPWLTVSGNNSFATPVIASSGWLDDSTILPEGAPGAIRDSFFSSSDFTGVSIII